MRDRLDSTCRMEFAIFAQGSNLEWCLVLEIMCPFNRLDQLENIFKCLRWSSSQFKVYFISYTECKVEEDNIFPFFAVYPTASRENLRREQIETFDLVGE